jgi:sensor histidine kinase regulating citrate/malate metabolism
VTINSIRITHEDQRYKIVIDFKNGDEITSYCEELKDVQEKIERLIRKGNGKL